MPRTGGCLCGQVRYELAGDPLATLICHCVNCQKQAGAAFSVNVIVAEPNLTVQGELRTFDDAGDSGNAVHRKFCPNCGSPIISVLAASPGIVALKAGTLDDTTGLSPQVQAWCDSKQDWVAFAAEIPGFPANPPSAG